MKKKPVKDVKKEAEKLLIEKQKALQNDKIIKK
jgi:hypothetical protein